MTYSFKADRWAIRDENGNAGGWVAQIGDQFLLIIVGGSPLRGWYPTFTQALNAGMFHLSGPNLTVVAS